MNRYNLKTLHFSWCNMFHVSVYILIWCTVFFFFFFSVLSLIMMVVIRYISKVLVWILTILVIIGSIGNFQKHTYMYVLTPMHPIHFDMFQYVHVLSLLSQWHYFDTRQQHRIICTGYCIQVWTLFCSDLLQVGQASSGGSMRTTGEPLIITPYQYLEKKLPQTM